MIPPKSLYIRQADISDSFAISNIGYSALLDSHRYILPDDFFRSLSAKKYTAKLENFIRTGSNILVVNNAAGYLMGYIRYGLSRDLLHPKEYEIYEHYIDRAFRSQHIGSMLLFEVKKRMITDKPIMTRLLKDNYRGRLFYERNGYRYQEDRDGSYKGIAPDVCLLKH